jgi:DNA invertase Pin-like site-specific DNA recombinase
MSPGWSERVLIAQFRGAIGREIAHERPLRARGRTGGQKRKLTARQVKIAQDMYDEPGDDGRRKHTVQHIAAAFGVTRPTIYRPLRRHSD